MQILAQPPLVAFLPKRKFQDITGIANSTFTDMVNDGRIILRNKLNPRDNPEVNLVAMYEIAARETLEKLG
ncbi:hypothetical protein VINE108274_02045 [Vibrio neptunius]|uniref:hypothetical protein n=1 Tax=Vibrio neptunius TaxID=170651 RepID=UPI001C5C9889|nr:hypothetical protein [Vibrio neptunius]QXX07565.1 hypothetical protein KW548_06070 [Vibrio neptunius]